MDDKEQQQQQIAVGEWLAQRFLAAGPGQPGWIYLTFNDDWHLPQDYRWYYWTGCEWQPDTKARPDIRLRLGRQAQAIKAAAKADGIKLNGVALHWQRGTVTLSKAVWQGIRQGLAYRFPAPAGW